MLCALSHAELDITDPKACLEACDGVDVVVNAAGWTAVDAAEAAEADAFAVNAVGAANLARACAASHSRLVQISTDYVFSGDATTPYLEDSPVHPVSSYGRTKAAGEWAVRALLPDRSWIVRTAWLYGANGRNFVLTILQLLRERETIEVVDDQVGQPTWTRDVAERIVLLASTQSSGGIVHATSSGVASWFELACEIARLTGADPRRVHPVTTTRSGRPAPRPAYSVLGHGRWRDLGLAPLPIWSDSLARALPELTRLVGPAGSTPRAES